MSRLFLLILNMSIIGSILLVIVLLLRIVLKRLPKRFFCILWMVAAVRMMLPFSLPQLMGLLQSPDETQQPMAVSEPTNELQHNSNVSPEKMDMSEANDEERNLVSQSSGQNSAVNVNSQTNTPSSAAWSEKIDSVETANSISVSDRQTEKIVRTLPVERNILEIVSFVWLIGAVILAVYAIISCLRLEHTVRKAVREENHIYVSSDINTPFILGLFRPRIYLPQMLSMQEREIILAHEKSHISHLDYVSKPLAFFVLMLHWFNPVVWVSYFMFCRDVEIACDERVLAKMGKEHKKAYASVLLQCSVPRRLAVLTPTAFGETAVKERIREILSYSKPSAAVTILCGVLILTMTAAACTGRSPVSMEENNTRASGVTHSPDQEPKILTEYEQKLANLQNEMYEPPLGVHYEPEENPDRESDKVILDIVDWLTEMCSADSDSEKQKQLYDEIFWKKDGDSPYRQIIMKLLFFNGNTPEPEDETTKQHQIDKFTNKIKAMLPELRQSNADAAEEQLIHMAVETTLKKAAHGDNPYFGEIYGYLEGVLLGKIDPESPRITLQQVLDIIEHSSHQTAEKSMYIYFSLRSLQKYPDIDFTGSGVYGHTVFYLAGKNEYITMVKGYGGFTSVTFSKTNDGVTYSEVLFDEIINRDSVWDFVSAKENGEEQTEKPINKTEPSPDAVGLLKFSSRYAADTMVEGIRDRYPAITQEQLDKVLILYDIAMPYSGNYAYQISIATGETDPSVPKLTLKDVQRIIKEASDTQDDNMDIDGYCIVKGKSYNVMKGIYQVQYYPDWINNEFYEYWLDGNSRKSRTEEIVMDVVASKIVYNRYNTEGKLIYTETLLNQ